MHVQIMPSCKCLAMASLYAAIFFSSSISKSTLAMEGAAISWAMPEKVIKNAGRIPHRNRFDMKSRYRNLLRRVNNILPFRRIPQH